ncbi:ankyrin-repeat containing palmitoyltransferase, putative [Candida dubliniensis CD36]|uniref:Palmitoyltransferase n=1 Tax=Candida dubliniensis (strain CD36 / ATCC MYA-646 / CBS 7987 / NCPF 3949 / NRRL Y-17841) TaxID=573826 RepID=B9W9U6_CANDC|nr:ankyrin-repeat containing palmitoyltransferase, putative [Candida dubliniensis CD36]CAX45583.1 ankyrin-repeat containing palmitoyltransferase, putative [Candida dubliniensis CD36]
MAKKKSKSKSSSPKPKVSSAKPVEIDNQSNIETVQDPSLTSQQPAPEESEILATSPSEDTTATTESSPAITTTTEADPIELSVLDNAEHAIDSSSIKSTEAVLETLDSELNTITDTKPEQPTEQELNPTLAKYMRSCQEGNLTLVKELISSGQISINDTFSDEITGLHWACINNRLSLVKFLIENGANPNQLGGELKASPLHWACRNGLVYIVDYLIRNSDADPNLRDSQTYNALHLAVHSSNIMLVIYLLLSCCNPDSMKKIYVDEPDGSNRTPLHWASYQNDIFTINALLRFGADVSKVDNSLFIPLHWAFMKGYKSVLKALVEAGSDIFVKNDQNKNSFDIAKDMNCSNTWEKVLLETGRDPKKNWAPIKPWVSVKLGKVITFLTPYFLLPLSFNVLSMGQGYIIPKLILSIGILAGGVYLLNKLVISQYIFDDKKLAKSPILAGVFSATAFWSVLVWLYNILPTTFIHNFFANIIMAALIGVFSWSFFKAMFINPGYVPTPADNNVILSQVAQLIELGQFDTDHFCVNSFVRKPLRSRYSKHNKKLIARFDHSCPWVYNDIGVRNHKIFITFVYSLNMAVFVFLYLSLEYFDKVKDKYESDDEEDGFACSILGDDMCYGYKNHHFHFNLLIWDLFQCVWISFLCIVQTFQILKGLTTWEFSSLNKQIQTNRFNHSTVPRDFEAGEGISLDQNQPSESLEGQHRHHHNEFQTCMNLLGIDQFILTLKMSIGSLFNHHGNNTRYDPLTSLHIPTDHGIKQNWLDFWIIGEEKWRNVFYLPIDGENNLNGKVVDYYTLYSYH